MALMLFHAARLDARLDDRGFILLMEDQDRTRWDQRLIARRKSSSTNRPRDRRVSLFISKRASPFIIARAKSYAETDWPTILRLYDALLAIHRSPVYLLNRAIVVAEIEGPNAGIRALDEAGQDPALRALSPLRRHARRVLPPRRRSATRPAASRSRQAEDHAHLTIARSSTGGWRIA